MRLKPDNKVQLTGYDLKINQQMTGFKAKLASELKSGETMSVDSALWYVGATANYTYDNFSNGSQAPGKTYIDSTIAYLPVNSGTLTIEQVNTFYEAVVDGMKELYAKVTDSDKTFGVVMLEPQATTGLKNGNTTQPVVLKTVIYSTWGLPWYLQFPESASYYWNVMNNIGQPVYPNAISKLQDNFAQYKYGDPNSVPLYSVAWINPVPRYIDTKEFTYGTGLENNYEYYYLAWNNSLYPDFHKYLCGDEMNFYMARLIEMATVKVPQKYGFTVSSTFQCYHIHLNGLRVLDGPVEDIRHSCTFWYATRVVTPEGPGSLD